MKILIIPWFVERREASFQQKIRDWMMGLDIDCGPPTGSGVNVSEYNTMQATAVYACVRILAETVASLPLPLYRKLDRGTVAKIKL